MTTAFTQENQPVRDILSKAMDVIMAREDGNLTLTDRKVWNCLLASTYGVGKGAPGQVFRAKVSELMACLSHGSTDRLHESLARLAEARVAIDYKDERGVLNSLRGHYLSYNFARTNDGWVHFAFDPMLIALVFNPRVFATLSLSCIRRFRSSHALKLYEILSLYINRRDPVWNVSLDDFRAHMALGDGYDRTDNLKRRVIEPAVAEVRELTSFVVDVDYVRGGRGGKVSGLSFSVRRPGSLASPDLAAIAAGEEQRAAALDYELCAETHALALVRLGERDASFEALMAEWQDSVRGLVLRAPDRSFLAWLDLKLARDETFELRMVEETTLSALLDQVEVSDGRF